MTEKTLKIRIKMHSPTDSPESSTDEMVEPEAHSETSSTSGSSDRLHMGVVAMISGVVMLTLALIFLGLSNRDEPQTRTDLTETTVDPVDESSAVSHETSERVALLSELEQERVDTTGDLEAVPAKRATDMALNTTAASTMASSSQDPDTVESPRASPPMSDAGGGLQDQSPTGQSSGASATTPLEPPSRVPTETRDDASTSGALRGDDSVSVPQTSGDLPNQSELTATASTGSSLQPEVPAVQAGTQSPRVARAQFTNGIQDREPVDRVESVVRSDGQTNQQLYYFTDLRNLKGETVTHRWEHQGQQVAEVSFKVGGNRWRVFSRKSLPPDMTGEWQVVVSASDGEPLQTASFVYQEP